ncbi:hypothetical protein TRVA0_019S00210 [Trichomonascus vanleenenianus]|uniref:uncharacterized protein n=1 Tax=Trichomonascus vanleenenianus TaxID=2268995 RepID=UPI003ECBACB3
MVYFSESIVLPPKSLWGVPFAHVAKKFGFKLDPRELGETYRKVTIKPQNVTKKFNPELFRSTDFHAYRHYASTTVSDISETMGVYKSLNPSISAAEFNEMCSLIYKRITHPASYFIPPSFQKVAKALNENHIQWGVITNSGPNFKWMLNRCNEQLSDPIFTPTPKVINAWDDGHPKPSSHIFRRAKGKIPGPVYFVGTNPYVDQVRDDRIGIRNVLLTEMMANQVSDIRGKPLSEVYGRQNFRIAKVKELYRVLLHPSQHSKYFDSDSFRSDLSETMSHQIKGFKDHDVDNLFQLLKEEEVSTKDSDRVDLLDFLELKK